MAKFEYLSWVLIWINDGMVIFGYMQEIWKQVHIFQIRDDDRMPSAEELCKYVDT